jgi:hypothetical protein
MVPLINSRGNVVAYATVDSRDIERLSRFTWFVSATKGNHYAYRRGPNHTKIYMHRELLGFPVEVDHRNGNGFDNRRSNLRSVTHRQNTQNLVKTVRGVTWHKRDKKWQAQVKVNGRNHYLGQFASKEVAERAALAGRLRLLTHSDRR